MGYNLYICRTESWLDAENDPITFDEWRICIEDDPEMRLDSEASVHIESEDITFSTTDPSIAVWTTYSQHEEDGNKAWVWLDEGAIVAKNPDSEVRQKMFRIASALQANLIGEENECYDQDGNEILPEPPSKKPGLLRRLFGR
ncbi:hypothetical protein [Poriferisphaera sp. WC338]|uniref:hypothetical protein n=1 Tax=Poriferisphaera sp. WC338 TaxID=3425129 RepID=UPI003D8187F2